MPVNVMPDLKLPTPNRNAVLDYMPGTDVPVIEGNDPETVAGHLERGCGSGALQPRTYSMHESSDLQSVICPRQKKETPRLCRGGSSSLTIPGVP